MNQLLISPAWFAEILSEIKLLGKRLCRPSGRAWSLDTVLLVAVAFCTVSVKSASRYQEQAYIGWSTERIAQANANPLSSLKKEYPTSAIKFEYGVNLLGHRGARIPDVSLGHSWWKMTQGKILGWQTDDNINVEIGTMSTYGMPPIGDRLVYELDGRRNYEMSRRIAFDPSHNHTSPMKFSVQYGGRSFCINPREEGFKIVWNGETVAEKYDIPIQRWLKLELELTPNSGDGSGIFSIAGLGPDDGCGTLIHDLQLVATP